MADAITALVVRMQLGLQNKLEDVRAREGGQTLVEYSLIIALIAIALFAALTFLKDAIADIFSKIGNALNNAV